MINEVHPDYIHNIQNIREVRSRSNVVPTQYAISEAASVFTLTATATQSPPVCVLIETHGQRGEKRAQ